jgi:2-oxoglutarate ferredoxin oxidoreductase subunit alpha
LPANVGEVLGRFRRVLVPEMNLGQLLTVLRARFLVDAVGLNKVQGRPFKVAEIVQRVEDLLDNQRDRARLAASADAE